MADNNNRVEFEFSPATIERLDRDTNLVFIQGRSNTEQTIQQALTRGTDGDFGFAAAKLSQITSVLKAVGGREENADLQADAERLYAIQHSFASKDRVTKYLDNENFQSLDKYLSSKIRATEALIARTDENDTQALAVLNDLDVSLKSYQVLSAILQDPELQTLKAQDDHAYWKEVSDRLENHDGTDAVNEALQVMATLIIPQDAAEAAKMKEFWDGVEGYNGNAFRGFGFDEQNGLSEAELLADPSFLKASAVLYSKQEGKAWAGSDSELSEWGVHYMAEFNNQLEEIVKKGASFAMGWSDDEKIAFAYALQSYNQTQNSMGAFMRATGYVATDTGTWASLLAGTLSLGAGTVAGIAAKQATQKTFVNTLLNNVVVNFTKKAAAELAEAPIKKVVTRMGAAGVVEGAADGGGRAELEGRTNDSIDFEDYSAVNTLTGAAIGGASGAATTIGLSVTAKSLQKPIGRFLNNTLERFSGWWNKTTPVETPEAIAENPIISEEISDAAKTIFENAAKDPGESSPVLDAAIIQGTQDVLTNSDMAAGSSTLITDIAPIVADVKNILDNAAADAGPSNFVQNRNSYSFTRGMDTPNNAYPEQTLNGNPVTDADYASYAKGRIKVKEADTTAPDVEKSVQTTPSYQAPKLKKDLASINHIVQQDGWWRNADGSINSDNLEIVKDALKDAVTPKEKKDGLSWSETKSAKNIREAIRTHLQPGEPKLVMGILQKTDMQEQLGDAVKKGLDTGTIDPVEALAATNGAAPNRSAQMYASTPQQFNQQAGGPAGADPANPELNTSETKAKVRNSSTDTTNKKVDKTNPATFSEIDLVVPKKSLVPFKHKQTNVKNRWHARSFNILTGFKRFDQNIKSAPAEPETLISPILDSVDKQILDLGLHDELYKLTTKIDELSALNLADTPDLPQQIKDTISGFAERNTDELEHFKTQILNLKKHIDETYVTSEEYKLAKKQGQDITNHRIVVTDSPDGGHIMLERKHKNEVLRYLDDLASFATNLQKPDFGSEGQWLRKALKSANDDNISLSEDIKNSINRIDELSENFYLRLASKGLIANKDNIRIPEHQRKSTKPLKFDSAQVEAELRGLAEAYHNPFPRATRRKGTANLEHTWQGLEEKHLKLLDDATNQVQWSVDKTNRFITDLVSMVDQGYEHEALYTLRFLMLRRGNEGMDTFPTDVAKQLQADSRFKSDPHFKHWAQTAIDMANVTQAGGATLFPWSAGRKPEQFYAGASYFLRYSRRYRGDGAIAKPGWITIIQDYALNPTLKSTWHLLGAKGSKPRENAPNGAYRTISPDWGEEKISWYKPTTWPIKRTLPRIFMLPVKATWLGITLPFRDKALRNTFIAATIAGGTLGTAEQHIENNSKDYLGKDQTYLGGLVKTDKAGSIIVANPFTEEGYSHLDAGARIIGAELWALDYTSVGVMNLSGSFYKHVADWFIPDSMADGWVQEKSDSVFSTIENFSLSNTFSDEFGGPKQWNQWLLGDDKILLAPTPTLESVASKISSYNLGAQSSVADLFNKLEGNLSAEEYDLIEDMEQTIGVICDSVPDKSIMEDSIEKTLCQHVSP